jgi:hypothetical protein
MNVNTVTISFIIYPFSFENVTVNVPELASTARFVELPVAFILGSVFPFLASVSMLHISIPLSSVSGSIFELNSVPLFQLRFIHLFMHIHGIQL